MPRSPYSAKTIEIYTAAGWTDLIPILAHGALQKDPPPKGYTGGKAKSPTAEDHKRWLIGLGGKAANVALHMHKGVVGIDVDQYGLKKGTGTLAMLAERLGPLPLTPRNSARGPSEDAGGHYFYRVKPAHEDLRWPEKLGPDIDVLQFHHRYAVVWPSYNPHAEMAQYRWYDHNNQLMPTGAVPYMEDLPYLPDKWVAYMTSGQKRTAEGEAEISDSDAYTWLRKVTADPRGHICSAMKTALNKWMEEEGHSAMVRGQRELIRLGVEGHTGLFNALDRLNEHHRIAFEVEQ